MSDSSTPKIKKVAELAPFPCPGYERMVNMGKKLYRSRSNKKVAGILGGLGQYLGIDPTLLRVLFVILSIITVFFPFALVYLICAFIIPYDNGVIDG